jgi:hypothetical protein
MTTKALTLLVSIAIAITAVSSLAAPSHLPVTGGTAQLQDAHSAFSANGVSKAKVVTSVQVTGKFTYAVSQNGNAAPSGYTVGQYAYAASKNNLGFIAHNYLAGSSFYGLTAGDEVVVSFSDGTTKTFVVYNVARYQATNSNDFSKPFIDARGKQVSARQVFNQSYKAGQVTFQTCITADGSLTWGVIIIQASPKK